MAAKAATKLTLLLIECKVMGKIYTINTFLSLKKKLLTFQEKILNNSSSCPPVSAPSTESSKSRRAKLVFDDR